MKRFVRVSRRCRNVSFPFRDVAAAWRFVRVFRGCRNVSFPFRFRFATKMFHSCSSDDAVMKCSFSFRQKLLSLSSCPAPAPPMPRAVIGARLFSPSPRAPLSPLPPSLILRCRMASGARKCAAGVSYHRLGKRKRPTDRLESRRETDRFVVCAEREWRRRPDDLSRTARSDSGPVRTVPGLFCPVLERCVLFLERSAVLERTVWS